MKTRRDGCAAVPELPVHVRLTRLGQVAPRTVGWLWPERVPLGKVTLLVGDPGRGKSLLALDMAARVTRGAPWPEEEVAGCGLRVAGCGLQVPGCGSQVAGSETESGAGPCAGPNPQLGGPHPAPGTRNPEPGTANPVGGVILLSAEDDAADTIRPRLEAAGGDPDRVVVLQAVRRPGSGREGDLPFSLSRDLAALEAAIRDCQDVRLVVLDPVSAYLAGADTHSNADMREVLAPLRGVAERTGAAVVAISHLTKRADAAVLYRAMGSLAFVAAARAVWAVGPDRHAAGRLLFLPVKCNLSGRVRGLAYRIVPSPGCEAVPVLAWEAEPVELTAADALDVARLPRPTRYEVAEEWLAGLLADGPMPCQEVERRARAAGISFGALRRAKREMGAVAYREGFGTTWMLRLAGDGAGPLQEAVEDPSAPAFQPPGSDSG